MPDATPALTRDDLQFLRDVAAGHVTRKPSGRDKLRHNNRSSFVDRKVERFEAAGLIHLDDIHWRLTTGGEAVVAADDATRAARQEALNNRA